jgi:hypothetical protein
VKCISLFWEEVHCKHSKLPRAKYIIMITNKPAPCQRGGPKSDSTALHTDKILAMNSRRASTRQTHWLTVGHKVPLAVWKLISHSSYCLNKQLLKTSFCVSFFASRIPRQLRTSAPGDWYVKRKAIFR